MAATLLFFAWKGNELDLPWPPEGGRNVVKPEPETLAWVEDVPVENMLPKDRLYLKKQVRIWIQRPQITLKHICLVLSFSKLQNLLHSVIKVFSNFFIF